LRGFGSLSIRKRSARNASGAIDENSSQTERNLPYFRMGKALRERLNP
jgi:nucleoid DNA-binding protein